MTLKFIFSWNGFQPNQRERMKVKASLPSLFLQLHKVPFNDHIFLHENAWPFSGLCFGVILIIAWCIFLMPNAFIFLTQNASSWRLFSWNILQTFIHSLQGGQAPRECYCLSYCWPNLDLRISRKHHLEGPYLIQWWVGWNSGPGFAILNLRGS